MEKAAAHVDLKAMTDDELLAYLADRNVFGVDLNPVAVELAEVSKGQPLPARVPWFGYRPRTTDALRPFLEKIEAYILTLAGVTVDAQAEPGKLRVVSAA